MAKIETWPEPAQHPKRSRGERRFDQSQLRAGGKGRVVNRDYGAHFFRWGFALTFHKMGGRSLEVGCGQDQPLIRVLTGPTGNVPSLHVAVDLNKIAKKSGIAWTRTHDEFNFVDDWRKLAKEYGAGTFQTITCFEVIEHMSKADGRKLLAGIHALLAKDGVALVSTPVYNEKHMATAHIHEYRYKELHQEFTKAGFQVERVHGTFMTYNNLKKVATKEERALIDELRLFHSYEVLACFLAPKYPQAASNCCWVLRHA